MPCLSVSDSSPEVAPTTSIFGMRIARITLAEAVDKLLAWSAERNPCRYVVTPNVDHVVKFRSNAELRSAYAGAALVVADGWPLVTASRLLGEALPERVAGSDLVPQLLASSAAGNDFRIFLLGGAPGVTERAAANIRRRWPHVTICGCASPPRGFESDVGLNAQIIDQINLAGPQLLIVALGAPRQEIWLYQHASQLQVRVAIAAGATIDFLAGAQTRAPRWVQQLRLEWCFRLLTDPTRLAGRYFRDAVVFPQLVFAEVKQKYLIRSNVENL
jgi:N-acetylglucosaminyldiphosphoundecaprenol N-acetyl-beta-D-mannosaminyltransferase